jgi:type I restriction enzyme, S subunit
VNPEVADPDFVCAYINSDDGRAFVKRNMGRAIGQVNISASVMSRMPIPLPSLARQKEAVGQLKRYELAAESLAAESASGEFSVVNALSGALLRRAFCGEI